MLSPALLVAAVVAFNLVVLALAVISMRLLRRPHGPVPDTPRADEMFAFDSWADDDPASHERPATSDSTTITLGLGD